MREKDLEDKSLEVAGERQQFTRRAMVIGAASLVGMCALGGAGRATASAVVRPPGGQDQDMLWATCLHCQKCYEACPRNVITMGKLEDGIFNLRTPKMTFSENWCDGCAEANDGVPLCALACPTESLTMDQIDTPENTVIGKAEIVEDWCLAYRVTGCKYCFNACPYGAISLDSLDRPVVDETKCNGCGACEAACVSMKNATIAQGATKRAITVNPLNK